MIKQVIFHYCLPLIITLLIVYFISSSKAINTYVFSQNSSKNLSKGESNFIESFKENSYWENEFLNAGDSAEIIYLLGSSELAAESEAIPYTFISSRYKTKVKAIGHAGNQCLSIFAQLLANEERLLNAPLVIILSPGWFESKPSKGTSSAVFLEFNSERFLSRIISNNNSKYKDYLNKRVSQLYSEFSSPHLALKWMNFKHCASKSVAHKMIFSLVLYCDEKILNIKTKIMGERLDKALPKRFSVNSESVFINWDSLAKTSKLTVSSNSTNNSLGIANGYYTEFIHGKDGKVQKVSKIFNQELEDFYMLLNLITEKKVNASFIISPLNPLYYKNLSDLAPTIQEIENSVTAKELPLLNLFEPDKNKYDKALLHDVMHLSDYGWYKVDKFIVDTYHLSQ